MQISSIQSIAPISSAFNPVLASKPATSAITSLPAVTPKASPANDVATISATATSNAASSATATTASAKTASSHASQGSSSGSISSAAELETTLAGNYDTTVGGVQYSGSVDESGGTYTATIPNLPGASATGTSLIQAENNLQTRIYALV